jgi:hypothetical protein
MALTPDPSGDPETVSLWLLRRYLMAHGWRRPNTVVRDPPGEQSAVARAFFQGRTTLRRDFDRFVLSEEGLEDIEIILPRERSSPDFSRQMNGALRTLSDLQQRKQELIADDIKLVGFDVMRSRIPNSIVVDDTIKIEVAKGYINGVRNLLAVTATTELQPDPFFSG